MKNNKNTPVIAALISVLGWGMVGVFIRLSALQSPLLIIALRFAITFIALLLVLLVQKNIKHTWRSLFSGHITLLLSLILFLTYLLGTIAFMLSSIAEVTLLISISPLFVILFRRLKGETITAGEYAGTLTAVAGVIVILLPRLRHSVNISSLSLVGDLLAIIAALLFALFALITNRQSHRGKHPNSMSITLGTCLFGIVILVYVFSSGKTVLSIERLQDNNALSIAALGILSTAIPTLGFAYASKNTPPLLLSNILLLEPVFAAVFAYLFLAEVPNAYLYLGILLIVAGLLTTSRRPKSAAY